MELREALRAACLAHTGSELPTATGTGSGTAPPRRPAGAARGRARARPSSAPPRGLTGVPALTARIAAGIATAAATAAAEHWTWQRLKACEAHDCLWVFYDRSPAGRSRWCSMAVCGSRAKMRRTGRAAPAP